MDRNNWDSVKVIDNMRSHELPDDETERLLLEACHIIERQRTTLENFAYTIKAIESKLDEVLK